MEIMKEPNGGQNIAMMDRCILKQFQESPTFIVNTVIL